jgi:hypothetical protein
LDFGRESGACLLHAGHAVLQDHGLDERSHPETPVRRFYVPPLKGLNVINCLPPSAEALGYDMPRLRRWFFGPRCPPANFGPRLVRKAMPRSFFQGVASALTHGNERRFCDNGQAHPLR